ncbi:MAG: hypothetical protein A3B71_00785 [Gammaproteobacteria bacterium RIFCSPHIGHO2_02_FULL_42_43]|nr:MAG: hypothetical protein A3B71_00785 [Gammaproteobacteria bacterium RIFCSPHIGHO2_02_FULL_42_43]
MIFFTVFDFNGAAMTITTPETPPPSSVVSEVCKVLGFLLGAGAANIIATIALGLAGMLTHAGMEKARKISNDNVLSHAADTTKTLAIGAAIGLLFLLLATCIYASAKDGRPSHTNNTILGALALAFTNTLGIVVAAAVVGNSDRRFLPIAYFGFTALPIVLTLCFSVNRHHARTVATEPTNEPTNENQNGNVNP